MTKATEKKKSELEQLDKNTSAHRVTMFVGGYEDNMYMPVTNEGEIL